jgi:aspartate kinase
MQVGLIQNSAVSFSICVEDKYNRANELFETLNERYEVEFVPHVDLYTVRHHTPEALEALEIDRSILLRQYTSVTMQMVIATN